MLRYIKAAKLPTTDRKTTVIGTHFFFVDSFILFMSLLGMKACEKAGIVILMLTPLIRNE